MSSRMDVPNLFGNIWRSQIRRSSSWGVLIQDVENLLQTYSGFPILQFINDVRHLRDARRLVTDIIWLGPKVVFLSPLLEA